MKKVLFISYNGMTDPLGQAQVLPYLLNLAKKGFSISILSMEKQERMVKEEASIRKIIDQGDLKWHPLTFHNQFPIVSKIYDQYLLKKAAVALYKKEKFDLIHCRSYVAAEVGLHLKEKLGAKIIFDMRGFWADEKKDSNHWNVNKPLFKHLYNRYKNLELKLLNQSDAVVVLTQSAKDEIARWNFNKEVIDKIQVIPCCADLAHFSDTNINTKLRLELIKEFDIQNASPVLCYLGSIGEAYAIKEMLYFFSRLKAIHEHARFLFFTKDNPQLVHDQLHHFPNISEKDIAVRFIQRSDLPTYLSLCDFSIFFYVPTYSRIACSPTKFAEISGMGLQVICNAVGDLNKTNLKGLPHIVIDDLQKETIDRSISTIKVLRLEDKLSIKSFVKDRYDLHSGVEKYYAIYKTLTA